MFILQIMMIEVMKRLMIVHQTVMIISAKQVVEFVHRQKVKFAVN